MSHYLRNLTTDDATNATLMSALAVQDAKVGSVETVLDIGAQTIHAPLDVQHPGVLFTGTSTRVTYQSLVSALFAYARSYRAAAPTAPLTLAIATNNDGNFSNYPAADKGRDWATQVINPLRSLLGDSRRNTIRIVGADDIEAGFASSLADAQEWEASYLASTGAALQYVGSADGCPTAPDTTHVACGPVVDDNGVSKQWSQQDYYGLTHDGSRISVLPQVYVDGQAMQWANISRTGTTADTGSSNGQPPLAFAGALSEQAACNTKDSGCRSFSPVRAWHELATALATVDVALGPVATDLDIVS